MENTGTHQGRDQRLVKLRDQGWKQKETKFPVNCDPDSQSQKTSLQGKGSTEASQQTSSVQMCQSQLLDSFMVTEGLHSCQGDDLESTEFCFGEGTHIASLTVLRAQVAVSQYHLRKKKMSKLILPYEYLNIPPLDSHRYCASAAQKSVGSKPQLDPAEL